MRLLWWNVQHLEQKCFDEAFWEILEDVDIAFLVETHHEVVPNRAGWQCYGKPAVAEGNGRSGGVVVLIRNHIEVQPDEVQQPFDGFIWVRLTRPNGNPLWCGGVYIPGASDRRFRSLQGHGKTDHFKALREQLEHRAGTAWLLGGDLNAATGSSQPLYGSPDILDHAVLLQTNAQHRGMGNDSWKL